MLFVTLAKSDELTYDGLGDYSSLPISPTKVLYANLPMFYPIGSPSGNTLWVKASSTIYERMLIGGLDAKTGAGQALSENNTVYVGSDSGQLSFYHPIIAGFAYVAEAVPENSIAIARGNKIIADNIAVQVEDIFAGFVNLDNYGIGYAIDNSVVVSRFERKSNNMNPMPSGAYIYFTDTSPAGRGEARGNSITIIDSTMMRAYGAYIRFNNAAGTQIGIAIGNSVTVIDSEISGNIHGSAVCAFDDQYGNSYIQANSNMVTLQGNVQIGKSVNGSYNVNNNNSIKYDIFTGNTLNVVTPKSGGITVVDTVRNFEFFNFTFSPEAPTGTIGLLVGKAVYLYETVALTSTAKLSEGEKRSSTIASINILEGGTLPTVGHTYVLLKVLEETFSFLSEYAIFNEAEVQGVSGENVLTFELEVKKDELVATLMSITPQEDETGQGGGDNPPDETGQGGDNHPPDETGQGEDNNPPDETGQGGDDNPPDETGQGEDDNFTDSDEELPPILQTPKLDAPLEEDEALSANYGGIALMNEALDSLSNHFMDAMLALGQRSIGSQGTQPPCPSPAFSFSGGSNSLGDEGQVDINSYSVVLGVGCGRSFSSGVASFAVLVEGGAADFESTTVGGRDINAEGTTEYLGGGLAARFDFKGISQGHFYSQIALHFGKIRTNYKAPHFKTPVGNDLGYRMDSDYVGGLVGVGFVFNLSQTASLDLSTKYLVTQIQGGSAKSNMGQDISIEKATSQRIKGALTYFQSLGTNFSFSMGMGVEHEFDGEQYTSVEGYRFASTDTKGASFTLDAGIHFRPSISSPLSISIGTQGSLGRRKGVTGALNLNYSF
ncbi:MAG: hypothetical protein LBE38_05315 [Deltaproteobacteria bacterium]|nr:hypothetical protein [Deltaproteobacteria bacterium]